MLNGLVVDERNMPGKTIGQRRLQCGRRDLLPLKKAVMDFVSMLHSKHNCFIDSKGMPFVYEKTLSSKLSCYPITKVDRKDTASLLWLRGVAYPFTIPRPPADGIPWARLLHINNTPWMLYDYVSHPTKDTYRRV